MSLFPTSMSAVTRTALTGKLNAEVPTRLSRTRHHVLVPNVVISSVARLASSSVMDTQSLVLEVTIPTHVPV